MANKKTKVKILIPVAGGAEPMYDLPDFGYAPGQIVELHPKLAQIWIATGKCEAV